jgi:hypothetical protein
MKTLLALLLLSSNFIYQIGNAKVGDVYYCIEKYSRGVETYGGVQAEKNYIPRKFTFKRLEDAIVFNEGKDNRFGDYYLNNLRNMKTEKFHEHFIAWRQSFDYPPDTILTYQNGNFSLTENYKGVGIFYSYAECSIF